MGKNKDIQERATAAINRDWRSGYRKSGMALVSAACHALESMKRFFHTSSSSSKCILFQLLFQGDDEFDEFYFQKKYIEDAKGFRFRSTVNEAPQYSLQMEHRKIDFDVNNYGEEDEEKQGEEGKNGYEGTTKEDQSGWNNDEMK
ncbi:hypothetical protein HN51_058025 [Arachis hypogaea]